MLMPHVREVRRYSCYSQDWEAGWRVARNEAWVSSPGYEEFIFEERGSREAPSRTFIGVPARDAILGRTPGQYSARCPAHDDRSASLRILVLPDGKVLVRCWAGCDTRDVLAAMSLAYTDLFHD